MNTIRTTIEGVAAAFRNLYPKSGADAIPSTIATITPAPNWTCKEQRIAERMSREIEQRVDPVPSGRLCTSAVRLLLEITTERMRVTPADEQQASWTFTPEGITTNG